jgi:hypothetical protein
MSTCGESTPHLLNAPSLLRRCTIPFASDALSTPFFSADPFHGVQARPAGPPDLPLHPRIDQGRSDQRFAAMAVSRYQTAWSIKRFVSTTRRNRTARIKAGRQILTAADPLPRRPPQCAGQNRPRQCALVGPIRVQNLDSAGFAALDQLLAENAILMVLSPDSLMYRTARAEPYSTSSMASPSSSRSLLWWLLARR